MIEVLKGQLCQDGKPIRPEIGNKEHIEAIKRAEANIEKATKGIDFEIEADVHYRLFFRCTCGKIISIDGAVDEVDMCDVEDEIRTNALRNNAQKTCYYCGTRWIIDEDKAGDIKAYPVIKK